MSHPDDRSGKYSGMPITPEQEQRAQELLVTCTAYLDHGTPELMSVCRELIYLQDKQAELVYVLRWLHDLQNGCPLPSYESDWIVTMNLAINLLKELEPPA